ncbi:MAG: hypothetical protein KDC87_19110 [Planctomycetes bacterium]|nr:hypothetical protein [Planctomycetota bacterium]MCB9870369.1 hypothetical protein [Planctomycetota bacterium]
MLSIFFLLLSLGLVAYGAINMEALRERTEVRFRGTMQANMFSRAGLTETLNWFRNQAAQPVQVFAPKLNTAATPQVLETDDPEIGLVREFQISKDIWGRYEVWKPWDADPVPERLAFRKKVSVVDVSLQRGYSTAGCVWLARSLGYVFQRRDASRPFNQSPNRVLARSRLEVEFQRLSLKPPGQSALCADRGDRVAVGGTGRIVGGTIGAGVYFPKNTGTPAGGFAITGNPALSASDEYSSSCRTVFGVNPGELRSMADRVVTNASEFSSPIGEKTLVFVELPSITFDASKSLLGTGVLYVKGNVTLAGGNKSSFSGLLYVDGNLVVRESADLYGAVVCTGTVDIAGTGDYAKLHYDDSVLDDLRKVIGQYRWSTAIREVGRD